MDLLVTFDCDGVVKKVYREICASAIKNNGYVIREISKGITR